MQAIVSQDPIPQLTERNVLGLKRPSAATQNQEFPFGSLPPISIPAFSVSIEDFGAEEGGVRSCTAAFAKAIKECTRHGGGTVNVPAGRWLTGPICFQSNIGLHLAADAVVLFSTDPREYLPNVYCQRGGSWLLNYSPLIYGHNLRNVAITGRGTFDGQGEAWWGWARCRKGMERLMEMTVNEVPWDQRVFGTEEAAIRPPMLQFLDCSDVLLDGFTIKNSPSWTIHPVCCTRVTMRNLHVLGEGPNNDGIDPDCCSDVLIEDCIIDTGDDCIALKAGRDQDGWNMGRPTERVVIRRVTARKGHGAIVIGSEISAGVRNVLVEDCIFDGTERGVRIKTAPGRGGFIRGVFIRRIEMRSILEEAIIIVMDYGSANRSPGCAFASTSTIPTQIEDIQIEHVLCTSAKRSLEITGDVRMPINRLSLLDIAIRCASVARLTNVRNLTMKEICIERLPDGEEHPIFQ